MNTTLLEKRVFADVQVKDLEMGLSWIRTGPKSNDIYPL